MSVFDSDRFGVSRVVWETGGYERVAVGAGSVTAGSSPQQTSLLKGTGFVGDRIPDDSIFAVLHRDGHRLFPDEMFADLY
ncbi:MAG: hypothetical protein ACK5PP_08795, partial [Acidimicrobiales bacterium]